MGCHLWGSTESDTTEATQQQQQQRSFRNVLFNFHIFLIFPNLFLLLIPNFVTLWPNSKLIFILKRMLRLALWLSTQSNLAEISPALRKSIVYCTVIEPVLCRSLLGLDGYRIIRSFFFTFCLLVLSTLESHYYQSIYSFLPVFVWDFLTVFHLSSL